MRRGVRIGLVLIAVPVVLVGGLALGAETLLNTDAVRGRVQDALARATGHGVELRGRLGLAWSATPRLSVGEVVLLNAPGYSRPAFATVRRVEASVAPGALLSGRVEVPEVVIQGADVLLERDAQGRGNWLPPAVAAPVSAQPAATPGRRTAVEVTRVSVRDATVAWLGAPGAVAQRLDFMPGGGPIDGVIAWRDVPFQLGGRVGALDRAPLDVDVNVVGGGVALSAAGVAGGTLAVQVLMPDLAALQQLAGRALPALKAVAVSAQAGPAGVGALRLTVGASDLGGGLRLEKLEAKAAGFDQPVVATAEGAYRALKVLGSLNLASPAALAAGGRQPFQALLLADGASVSLSGGASGLGTGNPAVDANLSASVPDLRRSAALALGGDGAKGLPALRELVVATRLQPAPSNAGVLVRGLRVTSAQGDVAGDLAVGWGGRASLRGSLVSQRMDLDALWPAEAAAPAVAPAAPAAGGAAKPAAPPAGPLVPATPLPFAALRAGDADVRLAVAQATWRGAAYRAMEARVLLQDGRLRVDPAQVQTPGGGAVQGTLVADATATPPTATMMLRAAGVDVGALDTAGGAAPVSGTMDLDVQLAGAGADLRAFTLAAAGHVGAAMIDGEVDNQTLIDLAGPALKAAGLPAEAQGRSRLRCMAMRLDLAGGIMRVAALGVDTTRLRMEGEGAVNLIDDTVDLHLRPVLRIGPTAVTVPVRLTGPARAPKPELERGAISPGRVGLSIGGGSPDPCPAALTAARDGRAGRMP